VPEAINLWLGNSLSISALHQDNYENIYCQIIGKKHFVLLPPLSSPCVGEQDLKPASYIYRDGELNILEEEGMAVRFPTWDPDHPNARTTSYSHLASPMRITLEPGDILYLPALWLVGWLILVQNAHPFSGTTKSHNHVHRKAFAAQSIIGT
jgi:jumonji domain-containing protein 7